MSKKQELTPELREAITEAAAAGALSAYGAGTHTNYFQAVENLLRNYRRLEKLLADKEAYCDVEYHAGKKTFSAMPQQSGYVARKTEEEIVEEMRAEREKQYGETIYGFERLKACVREFENQKEFVVIRLYYFGENVDGTPRSDTSAPTWEDVTAILAEAGVLKETKTARRWRNKIVNDMAVCLFGLPAAVSAGTYRRK